MFRRLLTALGLGACLSAAPADWKITTATTWNGHRSVSTEYYKGKLRRTDHTEGASVVDREHGRQIVWSNSLRQYVVNRLHYAARIVAVTGPRILIEEDTADTGERRKFFGHEARHLITRATRGGAEESTTDGWYVDSPDLPRELRASSVYLLAANGQRPDIRVHRSGPAPSGLMVYGRKMSGTGTWTIEVTDLFEGILPDSAFQAPPGFTRVIEFPGDYPLPWTERLRRGWEMLEDWISGVV
ncbi:MAG TPA: hypothetical protein VFA04_18810 [Bryobacteraceae bacterium]|nr:hypothetical protein [Bryobacteraceae bacterium]